MDIPKFKYELEALEDIIVTDLAAFIEDNSRVDDWLIDDFKEALKRSTEKIKMNMQLSILYYNDDTREMYIQYHQQAIIRLTGHLTRYGMPNPAPPPLNHSGIELLSYYLLLALEDLLSFVEKRYTKYFDADTWLPPNYLSLMTAELRSKIDNLQVSLLAIGVEREFVNIIMQPFWTFAIKQSTSNGTTYNRANYLKQLELKLEKIVQSGSSGYMDKALHTLLVGVNFNLPEYFAFCTKRIKQELKKADGNDHDQLYLLARYHKLLHQVPIQLGAALNASQSPLYSQLVDWIRAERECIETNVLGAESGMPLSGTTTGFRILIGMTVAQLSYFMGVLIGIGLIQNKNKSTLSQFMTTIFQTTGKEGMAKNSVRKNMYIKDDSVRQAVRAYLVKCIAYIDTDIEKFDG